MAVDRLARIERAIQQTSDLRVLKLLNREWWREFFMTVLWLCECGERFESGRDAFLHRSTCTKTCKPVSEFEIPLKRMTGIEREQMEEAC